MYAYCPPTSGRRCASSAYTNAPASAITPPAIQTPSMRDGAERCCATTAGLRKMPAPMMPPITIIVASKTPSRLESPVSLVIEGALHARNNQRRHAIPDEIHDRARLAHESIHAQHDRETLHGDRARRREGAREHDEAGACHAR